MTTEWQPARLAHQLRQKRRKQYSCRCLTNTRFGNDLRIRVPPPIRLRVAESLRQKRTDWRKKRGRGRDRGDGREREIHERKRRSERRSEEERRRRKRDRREARARRRPSPSPLPRRRPDAHVGQEVEGRLCANKPGGGPRVFPERLSCEACWVRLAVEDMISMSLTPHFGHKSSGAPPIRN